MSQENVEVVREYFETVNDGDFARAMRYYADDVAFVVPAEIFLEQRYLPRGRRGQEVVRGPARAV